MAVDAPIVLLVTPTIGGGVAAATRVRNSLGDRVLIGCRGAGHLPLEADFTFTKGSELATLLRQMAPLVLVPNWLVGAHAVGQQLRDKGVPIGILGYCRSDSLDNYETLVRFHRSVDHVIAVSPECRAGLLNRGFSPDEVTLLPSPIPWSPELRRQYSPSPIRLCHGGRLEQTHKRVMDLPILVRELERMEVDYTLDIVGWGSRLEPLLRDLSATRHKGRVRYLGRWAVDEMTDFWRDRDLYVQVSETEGTSVAMLEAMAAGLVPVVTRATSGVAGVVLDGVNGYVVDVGDMGGMAAHIAALARSPERVVTMGAASHELAGAFSEDAHCALFVSIVSRVLEGLGHG